MSNCKICEMRDDPKVRKIYETKNKEISVILNPKLSPHLGRMAVIPQLHFETTMTNPKYLSQIFNTVCLMEVALDRAFQPDDIWLFYKGTSSRHFHIDLIPVYNVKEVEYDVSEEPEQGITQHIMYNLAAERTDRILLRSYSQSPLIPEDTKKGIENKIIDALAQIGADYFKF